MINVAIMEGWAGGPRLSKEFVQALRAAKFNITDPLHADVLIAHSTACYDLPLKSPVRLYFLIDPPYWPGKPIWSRVLQKKQLDTAITVKSRGWKNNLWKSVWETLYFFLKPKYTVLALKQHGELNFLNILRDKIVVLVRNQDDPFCSPDVQVALSNYPNVRYAILPGGHDDYMTNPAPYIDLLFKAL